MTFEQTITDMGILSNEVYNDNYFEYKVVDSEAWEQENSMEAYTFNAPSIRGLSAEAHKKLGI